MPPRRTQLNRGFVQYQTRHFETTHPKNVPANSPDWTDCHLPNNLLTVSAPCTHRDTRNKPTTADCAADRPFS
jgi:hypothetical protein